MTRPKKTDWFEYAGFPVRWWTASPIHRAAYCEARDCKGVTRRVERDAPRLEVDDGQGRKRVKSKGKRNTWVCQHCAINVPRKPIDTEQGELF